MNSNSMETKSILLVGVGGQGTILASKLLTEGLMEQGFDVKMSEVHGMSQRGGDVSSQVRYGSNVESPVIEKGSADILVSFEKMEALRNLEFLRPGGRVVVNEYEMPSMPILTGDAVYPENAVDIIRQHADTISINATEMTIELGNPKAMNMILLGTVIKSMGLEDADWDKIVRENVKPAFVDMNIKAIKCGMDAVQQAGC